MRCSVTNRKWCLTEQLAHATCGWNMHPHSNFYQIRGLAWYQICLHSLSRIALRVYGLVSLLIIGNESDAYQKLCSVSASMQATKKRAPFGGLQRCHCNTVTSVVITWAWSTAIWGTLNVCAQQKMNFSTSGICKYFSKLSHVPV